MKKLLMPLGMMMLAAGLFPAAIEETLVAPNPVELNGKGCTLIVKCSGVSATSDKLCLQIVDRQNQKVWERTIDAPVNGRNTVTWGLTNDRGKKVVRGIYYARAWFAADTTVIQTFKIAVR